MEISIPVEKYVLDNGLEVILSPEPAAATVATNLWYHVGAVDERPGSTGFAHLFEHMMFEGSGHVPGELIDILTESVGAYTNASTHNDYTNYVIPNLPPEQLELALWIESDRMAYLLDCLDARNLANQIAVVRNERRQNWEQAPYALTYQAVNEILFPAPHPYHASIIGSHTDIASTQLDDVRDFFRTYYVPNNATLAITGNFDPARARELVEKYFGTIPRGADVPRQVHRAPDLTEERRLTLTDDVVLPKLTLAWPSALAFAEGDADADVLAHVLAGDAHSLLRTRLIRELKVATSVYAYQDSHGQGSAFQIEVVAASGHTTAELLREVDDVLAQVRAADLDADRVEAAKTNALVATIRSVEAIGGFGDRADKLNLYNHYTGTPDYLAQDLAAYRAVTAQSLREFANRYLTDRRLVIETQPGPRHLPPDPPEPTVLPAESEPVVSAESWRDAVPGPGPQVPTTLPRIGGFTLPNGLRVFTVPMGRLPLVTASVVALGGSAADPHDRAGATELLGRVLREGDAGRTPDRTAAEVSALGASLRSTAEMDALTLSINLLSDKASDGLHLLADLVQRPGLREEDVARLRKQQQDEIRGARADVGEVARSAILPLIYGPAHPYDHRSVGNPDGVGRVTVDDLTELHGKTFTPATCALILTGDVDEARARELAQSAFGSWEGAGETPPTPGPARRSGPRLAFVDMPGATQTALRLGLPGRPRGDARFDPLAVGNLVLGGLFTSRLNGNLREDKGYTYGAFSFFTGGRGPTPFLIDTAVDARQTGPAIREIFVELERIIGEPVTDEELTKARQSLVASIAQLFPTTSAAARTTAGLFQCGLPTDFYDGLPGRVADLTPASLRQLLADFLDLDEMVLVVVGDRGTVTPQLGELALGEFVEVDADGRVLVSERA
ncbi:M16 family metallopeptidase [Sporichthya polymorpha]|uniref:M16 family metallopeptidase n=1 Tax=Sporichthya polymorpha TaxID=35751 RepID=UPI00035CF599|nr:pitrilysin family protein [Sporichthya polymorpha]